jgi:hypothetical protein
MPMEVKMYENCKLYILTKQGIQEIDPELVNVEFDNKRAIYKLKNNSADEIIVQAYNEKFASSKMLTILRLRREKDDRRNKPID